MKTAFVLILTSLTLVGLVSAAARDRHITSGDGEIFRYPKIIKWLLFTVFPGGAFFAEFLLKPIYPDGPQTPLDWIVLGIYTYIFLCLATVYFCAKVYFICIGPKEILIHQITGERRIKFSAVTRLDLVQGAKSEALMIFGAKGKKLMSVGATIQDFPALTALLKQRIQEFGGAVRHRDRMGKWS